MEVESPSFRPAEDDHPLRNSDFTWSPAFPDVGQDVRFEPKIRSSAPDDAIAGILWRIEGRSYNDNHPVHAFLTPGTHRISMTVATEAAGQYTVQKDIDVIAQDGESALEPSEPADTDDQEALQIAIEQDGATVNLSFVWRLSADQVHWDLGDGTTSNELHVQHNYEAVGIFDVVLRVGSANVIAEAMAQVQVNATGHGPRVVVGVTDTGINPYHEIYYRPQATQHPCKYVAGYDDCTIPALELTVGPDGGSYHERVKADQSVWSGIRAGGWYWIPMTNLIAVHCPSGGSGQGGFCILDDESSHGTGTTSNVLTEAPDALLVFNEGSSSAQLATAPVPLDIESNSWGSLAPLYAGFVNGPTGTQICHDSVDDPASIKFRSAGNNGPVPNMGDCWRNGFRAYSVSGGYPDGSHGEQSGSAPDFASYWCRPVASTQSLDGWGSSCGTSFAAPTAAGTAAAALLEVRRELDFNGPSTQDEVAPGISHEDFMDAVIMAATYDPESRQGFPSSGLTGGITSQTPWYWWGWGWLDRQVTVQVVDCAMGRDCPDNKSAQAWAFNDVRRSFASDGEP